MQCPGPPRTWYMVEEGDFASEDIKRRQKLLKKRPKYYGLNCWKWWYHTEWSSIVDTYNFNENEEENSGEDAKISKQSSVPAKEAKTKTLKPDVKTPKPNAKILKPRLKL